METRSAGSAAGRSERPALALVLLLAACGDSRLGDGGPAGADTGVADALPRDARPGRDASPDRSPGDAGEEDADLGDAQPDGGVSLVDGGAPLAGESCLTARPWPVGQEEILRAGTSTRAGRERLSCAAPGGGNAAEDWWALSLGEPTHVRLALGSPGWDAVLAARTSTCATFAEVCADQPTVLEVPAALGTLYLAVDGFAAGRGPYALTAELAPALPVPPANASCGQAELLALPAVARGHGFGATASSTTCPMDQVVYYRLELPATATLSVAATAEGGQDLNLALLTADCRTTLTCAAERVRQARERLERRLDAGTYFLAVGSRPGLGSTGSHSLAARTGPACRGDLDCPLGERCAPDLLCAAAPSATFQGPRSIPDGSGRLELPLPVSTAGPPRGVTLRLELSHAYPPDLVVELVSPGPDPVTVRLRSRSTAPLSLVYGSERPAEGPGGLLDLRSLASAAGTWTVVVEDRASGDEGAVLAAELRVVSE